MEDGQQLGMWLGTQRKRYQLRTLSEAERRKKRASALSDLEVQRLEALGVVWDVAAEQWERSFALLQAFVDQHRMKLPGGADYEPCYRVVS